MREGRGFECPHQPYGAPIQRTGFRTNTRRYPDIAVPGSGCTAYIHYVSNFHTLAYVIKYYLFPRTSGHDERHSVP